MSEEKHTKKGIKRSIEYDKKKIKKKKILESNGKEKEILTEATGKNSIIEVVEKNTEVDENRKSKKKEVSKNKKQLVELEATEVKGVSEEVNLEDNENTEFVIKKGSKKLKKKKTELCTTEASEEIIIEGNESTESVKKKGSKKLKKKKPEPCAEEAKETNEEVSAEDNESTETKKEISKRQLKKEKAELRAAAAREASKQATAEKVLNYISKWKHVRSEWKFEKLKQIWLIDNLLNDKYVPNESFTMILEYFEGCKGFARKQLINKATKIIKKNEENIESDEVIETEEYKRAKLLLQGLSTET